MKIEVREGIPGQTISIHDGLWAPRSMQIAEVALDTTSDKRTFQRDGRKLLALEMSCESCTDGGDNSGSILLPMHNSLSPSASFPLLFAVVITQSDRRSAETLLGPLLSLPRPLSPNFLPWHFFSPLLRSIILKCIGDRDNGIGPFSRNLPLVASFLENGLCSDQCLVIDSAYH